MNKLYSLCRGLIALGVLLAGTALFGALYLAAQNPGSPAPTVPQTYLDAQGNPLASGTVSTFVTGTSTSAVTYSEAGLNTRNANPVALDSAGRASIFLSGTQVFRFVVSDSAAVIQYTQDGVRPAGYTADQVAQDLTCRVRMTLTSGVPVTTADVTAATTIYATPADGDSCWLFDGTNWARNVFTETSLSLGSDAANTNYDLYAFASGGVFTLERLAWTNNTDRSTNLTRQNGVPVRSGALTRRWLGTYRTTTTIGQTEDSVQRRYVSNYYNAVPRLMRVVEDTNTWTYSTNIYRQVNANSSNLLSFVTGTTRLVSANVHASASCTTPGGCFTYVAIGDGTTSSAMATSFVSTNDTTALQRRFVASAQQYARVGFRTWVWLERGSVSSGTATWFGDEGNADLDQTGIWGVLEN